MPPQLRIVVTGDTNSGKSTLSNAVIGRDLLPVSFQSETSVITFVVPQQVGGESAIPVLHSYEHRPDGSTRLPELRAVATGDEAIRSHLEQLNRSARTVGSSAVSCVECRVDCPLRDSLNVFVPPAAEWQHVQFLDIGGVDEVLNVAVQSCADLAYALSHRLLICVRYDQTTSRATQNLILDIRSKAPYHFDDLLARRDRCPLIFVITQADQALSDSVVADQPEVLRQSLRALLHRTLPECPELSQNVPIVVVSAKNALHNDLLPKDASESQLPDYEWPIFEELLIECAGLKRDIIQDCKVRRAAYIQMLLEGNLKLTDDQWPYYALSIWRERRDLGVKLAMGSAIAVTSVGTAVALGVYLSSTAAAGAAAAQAASASAEASAAAAAANSWWAWAFGMSGQYGSAAAAAGSAAAAAEAAAASATATATVWGLGSAVAGVSTAGLTLSATASARGTATVPAGVTSVAGMTVVHASSVGARDVRMALRAFKFAGTPSRMKAGKAYNDVLFYPDGTSQCRDAKSLASMQFPFQLCNAQRSAFLSFDGSQLRCTGGIDRPGQLWWAVPCEKEGTFLLQNLEWLCNLRAEPASWLSPDRRMAARCTPEVPGQSWRALPGSEEGTVRLQNVAHAECLFYNGLTLGCYPEAFLDQDWFVVPKVPFYIGGFKRRLLTGSGQFFWPNGAPLFKGEVRKGKLATGFVFDERSVCHGHFTFTEAGAVLDGMQPDDVELSGDGRCITCEESVSMALMGKALKPCGHGVTCESCAQKVGECPYCRTPIEGMLRMT
ncbi:unnamed protein product [Polarella glacialis]|uniref:RING-type domain-containing protein n=1 Tax=Polarella glacialis TaxID=89957 RepID=A0A813IBI6_POLGL|nr:unnamed protein product [Polarella glacialis]